MPEMRLDKYLSGQGYGTRREIRGMLAGARIRVNDAAARRPEQKVDPLHDRVEVDGRAVEYREHLYIMLNKPAGVISASTDPRQSTVLDLLPQAFRRPGLFPAGRLDKESEGLLIITDDGRFSHEILSPRHHVWKQYYAVVDGEVGEADRTAFAAGVDIGDETPCLPAGLEVLRAGPQSEVLVTIREGRYHQVRRMFESRGEKVRYLRRTAMGGLRLDESLGRGESRELTPEEVATVKINQ